MLCMLSRAQEFVLNKYSQITEQIFVGSCIQTEKDVKMLSETMVRS
jgi:hypothetical protein